MVTVQKSVRINVIECCVCGSWIALTTDQEDRFRDKGGTFYCTIGHSQHFTETEVQRLTKALEDERRQTSKARGQVDDLLLDKAQRQKELRRLQRRTDNGVCPHCRRTFKQVTRHITKKHPAVAVVTGPVIKD